MFYNTQTYSKLKLCIKWVCFNRNENVHSQHTWVWSGDSFKKLYNWIYSLNLLKKVLIKRYEIILFLSEWWKQRYKFAWFLSEICLKHNMNLHDFCQNDAWKKNNMNSNDFCQNHAQNNVNLHDFCQNDTKQFEFKWFVVRMIQKQHEFIWFLAELWK